MDREDENPVSQDDVIVVDEVFTTNIDDLTTIDSTWIYDNSISVGAAGSILVANGSGDVTWSSIEEDDTRIKNLIAEHRIRGNIKNGKHTPKRCYE